VVGGGGAPRDEVPIRVDLGETILLVANLLGEVGEGLHAGDAQWRPLLSLTSTRHA
jgi:hypothetical protein